jgi:hypothetical protein
MPKAWEKPKPAPPAFLIPYSSEEEEGMDTGWGFLKKFRIYEISEGWLVSCSVILSSNWMLSLTRELSEDDTDLAQQLIAFVETRSTICANGLRGFSWNSPMGISLSLLIETTSVCTLAFSSSNLEQSDL